MPLDTHFIAHRSPGNSEHENAPLPELLTIQEAAKLLRKSRVTMYRLVSDGRVKGYQVAGTGRLLFKREELLALLTPVVPGHLTIETEEGE
jgi:excisionase family DNA binding protein